MLSFSQQSVFLSLGQYNSWWIISPRCYHSPSSQCFYHWVNTTLGGLLVPEGIILPVVSVSITGSIPLLVDYQSPRVSFHSWWIISHSESGIILPVVILPVVSITGSIPLLVDYQSPKVSWWITISPRGYHSPSSQCFYHWVNTTLGGLLVPRVSFSQQLSFSTLGSSQCFYHWVNTTFGGLLVPEGIILPVVSVSITGSTPLLVDYQSPRLTFSQQSVFLSLGHWVNTTLGGLLVPDYQSPTGSPRISFSQQSGFISLGQHHSWWIISLSQGQHHSWWIISPQGIILPVVSVSITGSTPLLVDYQSPMVSFSQQSVFISLGQYNSWWIISP